MLRKLLLSVLIISSSFALTFAAPEPKTGPDAYLCLSCAGGFIDNLNSVVVAALGTLFLALAVVGFFLGVVRFIWAQQQGEEKGIKAGKETLKWGILALFCAFSVYGIIRFGQSVLFQNPDDATKIKIPKFIIDTTPTPAGDGRVNPGPSGNQDRVNPGPSVGPGRVDPGSAGGTRVTGPNYKPSTSGGNGSTYTGPGANTSGGRGSTGACFSLKDAAMGSWVNNKCVVGSAQSDTPQTDPAPDRTSIDRPQGSPAQVDTPQTDPVQNDASCYTKNNGDSCDAGSGADSGYCEAGSCFPNSANP